MKSKYCSDFVLSHFPKPCKVRKNQECRLCGEKIKKGEDCCRWVNWESEGPITSHAHPECYNAMEGEDDMAWEALIPGDMDRPTIKMSWP